MQEMVQEAVREGIILPRSDDEIATNIRSYIVARHGSNLKRGRSGSDLLVFFHAVSRFGMLCSCVCSAD